MVKPAAIELPVEKTQTKPTTKPTTKPVAKSDAQPAVGTPCRPHKAENSSPLVKHLRPQQRPRPNQSQSRQQKTGTNVQDAQASSQAASKQPEAGKPDKTAAAGQAGDAGQRRRYKEQAQQQADAGRNCQRRARRGCQSRNRRAPRFRICRRSGAKSAKPAAKKLDTVVSVTKSQAGHCQEPKKTSPPTRPSPRSRQVLIRALHHEVAQPLQRPPIGIVRQRSKIVHGT